MSETRLALESFLDRIIFASVLESQKVQNKCVAQAKNWLLTQQDSDLSIGLSVVQDRKYLENSEKNRPSHQFADGEWAKLAVSRSAENLRCAYTNSVLFCTTAQIARFLIASFLGVEILHVTVLA